MEVLSMRIVPAVSKDSESGHGGGMIAKLVGLRGVRGR